MNFLKNHTIISLLLLLSIQFSYAQIPQTKPTDSKYEQKMESSLFTLYKAGNLETFNMISAQLRKIAEEEGDQWLPYYHSAYAYIMAAYLSKEKFSAEEYLNQAQLMLDKANKIIPHNDEISALQGFLYQARIGVNPEERGQEYIQKAVKEYDHARYLNPENPRPYYLIGQILYRIPNALGGNKENACKHFAQAVEKYKSFKPKSEFAPNWGKAANANMLKNCK
ncbi:MAG: hypothetical protein GQ527_09035 [Bacteroidales bacterium]|nr:hypothetical protein [Bacteroidales bacterium]